MTLLWSPAVKYTVTLIDDDVTPELLLSLRQQGVDARRDEVDQSWSFPFDWSDETRRNELMGLLHNGRFTVTVHSADK